MATYTFSKLTNNQTLSFSTSDVLAFDEDISAGDVEIDRSVSNTTYFTANSKRVEISGSFWALGSSNFTFAGGGKFLFGDSTTDLSADATGRKMTGTSGSDWLYGSSGADTFVGGAGDDQIYSSALPDSVRDVVSYRTSTAGITIRFYSAHNDGEVSDDGLGGADTIRYIDDLWGSDYADALTLEFGEFDDFKLYAGDDDVYVSAGSIESLDGGSGTDTLRFAWSVYNLDSGESSGAVNVNLATGNAKDLFQNSMTLTGIENVSGTSEGDTLTGNNAANSLTGNPGNDTLSGGGGSDTLTGGEGNDSLIGGSGTDTAVFSGSSTNYTVTTNTDGSTTVIGVGAYSTTEGTDILSGIERIAFDNAEVLEIASTDATDSSSSATTGTSANDKLSGTADNDIIEGLAGNDQINGGAGDDEIVGGAGVDKLTGGDGADSFVFDYRASGNADKLLDFDLDEGDVFTFDVTIFTALADGITVANVRIEQKAKTAATADQFLIFDTKGGKLYYDADGLGGEAAILIAGVKGSFTSIDFESFVTA